MSFVEELEEQVGRLLDGGQPSSALPLAEILCELDRKSTNYHLLRIRALFDLRDFDGVMKSVSSLTVSDGLSSESDYYGMRAAFELGNYRECLRFAHALSETHDRGVLALCYIGKCSELSGDTQTAVSSYCRAVISDPFCSEAMNALIERKLMDESDIVALIDSLQLPDGGAVLRNTYKARLETTVTPVPVRHGIPTRLFLMQDARREHAKNNLRQALLITSKLLDMDPFQRDALCLHLSILVDMKATPKLFEKSHFLSKSDSRAELAVYAIGCYYYALSNYERAGRYFSRATELDTYFSEAWIAYGHCYAKLEEGEQALDVYRRTLNMFPALHICSTYIGMQYSSIHQWSIAEYFFLDARNRAPTDSLSLNELGVLYMKNHKVSDALRFFQMAYQNLPNRDTPSEHLDCVIFNLATALRKLGEYNEAIQYYHQYVRCRPNASHGHSALGFTFHLAGNLKAAISHYHTALSIKVDPFCRDMLDRALATDFGQGVGSGPSWTPQEAHLVTPSGVSFSTLARTLPSESVSENSADPTPRLSVDRSLDF